MIRRPDDRDITVLIGAQQRHAEPSHLGQQQRRRVPVRVAGADADHGHPGVHRGEEVRIEIRRAVVRHLQHVSPHIGTGRHQVLLCFDLDIAGQQDPHPADLCAEHQRGVVRI
jgi:hypothetical protein